MGVVRTICESLYLTYRDARLCLLTALRLHNLTTQTPLEVWVAIGNRDRAPKLDRPPLRVLRYSDEALDAGVETRTIHKRRLRVTKVMRPYLEALA